MLGSCGTRHVVVSGPTESWEIIEHTECDAIKWLKNPFCSSNGASPYLNLRRQKTKQILRRELTVEVRNQRQEKIEIWLDSSDFVMRNIWS